MIFLIIYDYHLNYYPYLVLMLNTYNFCQFILFKGYILLILFESNSLLYLHRYTLIIEGKSIFIISYIDQISFYFMLNTNRFVNLICVIYFIIFICLAFFYTIYNNFYLFLTIKFSIILHKELFIIIFLFSNHFHLILSIYYVFIDSNY